jgi:hypothetical protein
MDYLDQSALAAGLDHIRAAPSDEGELSLIVARPAVGERNVLETAELSVIEGLVGDTWSIRSSKRTEDGTAHPDMQLNIMNARVTDLIAGSADRWALAGDQLYVDFDISESNLPAGTLLSIGTSVIEITDQPHTGCAKFSERFGPEALRWVNSGVGKELKLRGINARVITAGTITRGGTVQRL